MNKLSLLERVASKVVSHASYHHALESTPSDAPPKRDLVSGLEKGLLILECFDQDRSRLTINEVAERCGLARGVTRRYLITLEKVGYVNSDRKRYALTTKVLRLGQGYMHSAQLPRTLKPDVIRLATELEEASSAGILDGSDLICVAASSSRCVLSATLLPGTRVPAYCSATGRALLASLPTHEFNAWLATQRLKPLTPNTITDPEKLRAEIIRTREKGYAVIDQELRPGLRTIAVPLENYRGDVLAALSVSARASRVSMDQLVAQYLPALLQAQSRLRSLL